VWGSATVSVAAIGVLPKARGEGTKRRIGCALGLVGGTPTRARETCAIPNKITGRDFLAVDAELEGFHRCLVVRREPSIHRQIRHQRNVQDTVSTRRLKDDKRLPIGMDRNVFLALNWNLGTISKANRESAEGPSLNRGLDCFSCHGGN